MIITNEEKCFRFVNEWFFLPANDSRSTDIVLMFEIKDDPSISILCGTPECS